MTLMPMYGKKNLVNQLDNPSTIYGMEISAEKTKLKINSTVSSDIRIGGPNIETVQSFKYLGTFKTDEGSNRN